MNRILCALVGCGAVASVVTASVWQPPGTITEESQVAPYTLPDPLVMADGTRVNDGASWRARRRPELLRQFESVVVRHARRDRCRWWWRRTLARIGRRLAAPRFVPRSRCASPEPIETRHSTSSLYTPAAARGRAPVVVGLNFNGNQAVAADPGIALAASWLPARATGVVDNRATDKTRGVEASRWQVETLMSRGYALATAYYGDLDPDFDDGFQNGVHPLFYRAGQTRPADGEWGAIGAWAWGLSRMLDYLETRR